MGRKITLDTDYIFHFISFFINPPPPNSHVLLLLMVSTHTAPIFELK